MHMTAIRCDYHNVQRQMITQTWVKEKRYVRKNETNYRRTVKCR